MVRGRTKVASIDTKVAIDTFVQWFRFRRSGLMTAVEEKPICTMAAEVGNGGTAVNVDKERILAGAGRKPDPLLDLEKRHGDVDRESVLDLIAVIEDERRMRAAAAVLSSDTAVRERYRAQVREDSAMFASIRRFGTHRARAPFTARASAPVGGVRMPVDGQVAAILQPCAAVNDQGARRAIVNAAECSIIQRLVNDLDNTRVTYTNLAVLLRRPYLKFLVEQIVESHVAIAADLARHVKTSGGVTMRRDGHRWIKVRAWFETGWLPPMPTSNWVVWSASRGTSPMSPHISRRYLRT